MFHKLENQAQPNQELSQSFKKFMQIPSINESLLKRVCHYKTLKLVCSWQYHFIIRAS